MSLGPWSHPNFPYWSAQGFPTNGIFVSSMRWQDGAGTPVSLVEDVSLSERYGITILRPSTGDLSPGEFLYPNEPPTCVEPPCEQVLEVAAGPDVTPPDQAVINDVATVLVRNPGAGSGCACPDADGLQLTVSGGDDTTPHEHLILVGYAGVDADEARTTTQVAEVFAFNAADTNLAGIALGMSVSRDRTGEGFSREGPFCLAVALLDWAGNEGPRSEPFCLDTTDPDDPTVVWERGGGCVASPGGPWLIALLLWRMARRRRARA